MSSQPIENFKVARSAIDKMKKRGGTWACYQSHVMDSVTFSRIQFLQIGPECTHQEPPSHAPDGVLGLGWKFQFVGMIDFEKNTIGDKIFTIYENA